MATLDPEPTISDLKALIVYRDKRFRIFQALFMGIIGIALIVLVAAQFIVINQFQDQSAQRAAGLKQLAETAQNNTELSNQYLQCIARFFATTDRSGQVLTDLDQCAYERNGVPIPGLGRNTSN